MRLLVEVDEIHQLLLHLRPCIALLTLVVVAEEESLSLVGDLGHVELQGLFQVDGHLSDWEEDAS